MGEGKKGEGEKRTGYRYEGGDRGRGRKREGGREVGRRGEVRGKRRGRGRRREGERKGKEAADLVRCIPFQEVTL